jgi:hypothetical protein
LGECEEEVDQSIGLAMRIRVRLWSVVICGPQYTSDIDHRNLRAN